MNARLLMMGSKFKLKVLVTFIFAAVLTACGKEDGGSSGPVGRSAKKVAVKTMQVQAVEQSIWVRLPGRSEANVLSQVRPQVSGIIESVNFKEGGKVVAGQSLYTIRDDIYRAHLLRAQADLASAQATAKTASSELKRQESLLSRRLTSTQAYDAALLAYRQAEATVNMHAADLQQAKIELDYTQVKAPISGVIGQTYYTAGALVQVNQANPLATIQQVNPIKITMSQSSDEFLRFKREVAQGKLSLPQQLAVEIILSDGTTYLEHGKLLFSEVQVNESTGMVKLKASFANPNQEILPGMFVHTRLNVGIDPEAILVPQQAVFFDTQSRPNVYVLDAQSKVHAKKIKIGEEVGNQWRVTEGLKSGEKVVIEGIVKIAEDMEVHDLNESTGISEQTSVQSSQAQASDIQQHDNKER